MTLSKKHVGKVTERQLALRKSLESGQETEFLGVRKAQVLGTESEELSSFLDSGQMLHKCFWRMEAKRA